MTIIMDNINDYMIWFYKITYSKLIGSMITILKNTVPLKQRAFYHACIFATFSLYWTVVPIFLRTNLLHFTNTEIALLGFVSIAGVLLTPTIGKLADRGMINSLTTISMSLVALAVHLLQSCCSDPENDLIIDICYNLKYNEKL